MTRLRAPLAAAFFVALAAAAVPRAGAEAGCTTREHARTQLLDKYGERPVGVGLTRGGQALELWVSPEGRFTVLITWASGRTCDVAAGDGWVSVPVPVAGDDS